MLWIFESDQRKLGVFCNIKKNVNLLPKLQLNKSNKMKLNVSCVKQNIKQCSDAKDSKAAIVSLLVRILEYSEFNYWLKKTSETNALTKIRTTAT